MKILVIVGSLRKLNTYNIAKMIEERHKQISDCEYEYIVLKDMDLKLCTGCHACMTVGERFCPLKDDRDMIINKIEEADGVILACPTFSMNVSWVMKNFMDRLSFIMHRPRFFRQRFMLLVVSGSIRGGKDAMRSLKFASFAGQVVNRLIVLNSPGMNENKRNRQNSKVIKEAEKFAVNMNKKLSLKSPFSYLIWFSAIKTVTAVYKDNSTADYEYYRDKKYFIDVRLNKVQKITIKVLSSLFLFLAEKGFV